MISHIFRSASRWIFFAALVYAPWAYGATTSESIQITNWVLLAALVLWAIELLVSRRTPRFPRLLFFLTAALICVGGWMVFNAKSVYDSDFSVFVPLHNFAPPVTGSVDYPISATWMIRAALLLGIILFVGRSFSKQPMVASLVVCDWSGRRLDSIPRFTPESHRYAHDLLATAPPE